MELFQHYPSRTIGLRALRDLGSDHAVHIESQDQLEFNEINSVYSGDDKMNRDIHGSKNEKTCTIDSDFRKWRGDSNTKIRIENEGQLDDRQKLESSPDGRGPIIQKTMQLQNNRNLQ